jgi:[protein-PII] uridylyltransferase
LLASHSVQVRSAVLHTVGDVSVNTWRVDKLRVVDVPDPAYLVQQLERLEGGDGTVLNAIQRRESRVRPSEGSPPYAELVRDASSSASVIEVRATDRAGLLYALGKSLSDARLSIRSAHISTLAGQAIDTFYVTEADGSLPGPDRSRQAVDALLAAAGVTAPSTR